MTSLDTTGDLSDVRGALVEEQESLINSIFEHFTRRSMRWASPWGEYKAKSVRDFNNKCELLRFKDLQLDVNPEFVDLYNEHINKCIARQNELLSPENLAKKEGLDFSKIKGRFYEENGQIF